MSTGSPIAFLKEHLAPLLGLEPTKLTPGRMTYELRRLRLHGLIERTPQTHRYRVTPKGMRTAMFLTRSYQRILRPGLGEITSQHEFPSQLRSHLDRTEKAIDNYVKLAKLVA